MHTTRSLIDQLGSIEAAIADMQATAKTLRNKIIEKGEGYFVGENWTACVYKYTREHLNVADAKAKPLACGVSQQWLRAHTKSAEVTAVKLTPHTATDAERVAA